MMHIRCCSKSVISVVKKNSPGHSNITSHKLTELNNASYQLHNWWHTDSQSILLGTPSGGRAFDKRFGALFEFPEFLGSTTHTCNFIAYKMWKISVCSFLSFN